LYIENELVVFKKEHPEVNHREAFKQVAEAWKHHPSNPKRVY